MSSITYCPECELKELMAKITPETINKVVSKMAYQEGVSATTQEYEKRLETCRKCPSLRNEKRFL